MTKEEKIEYTKRYIEYLEKSIEILHKHKDGPFSKVLSKQEELHLKANQKLNKLTKDD